MRDVWIILGVSAGLLFVAWLFVEWVDKPEPGCDERYTYITFHQFLDWWKLNEKAWELRRDYVFKVVEYGYGNGKRQIYCYFHLLDRLRYKRFYKKRLRNAKRGERNEYTLDLLRSVQNDIDNVRRQINV